MEVRQATLKDPDFGDTTAKAIAEFLVFAFTADPRIGGDPKSVNVDAIEYQLKDEANSIWIAVDNGRIQGVIRCQYNNVVTLFGVACRANYFGLMVPDPTLTHEERVTISKALCLFAHLDNKKRGLLPDVMWSAAPTGSTGCEWLRKMGASEASSTGWSDFYLPAGQVKAAIEAVSVAP